MMLAYPLDRVDGHVLLTDGNGQLYVTEIESTPLRFCRACIELMRRMNINPFDIKDTK